jgi:uncharacterized protein
VTRHLRILAELLAPNKDPAQRSYERVGFCCGLTHLPGTWLSHRLTWLEMSEAADEVIRILALTPHPEGGHYVETHRDSVGAEGRGCGTAIYFLLRAGERSHWHRLDAVEIFHYYAGLPLEVRLWQEGSAVERMVLGPHITRGQRPQVIIPRGVWQAARPLPSTASEFDYSLVGCTVTPAFEFSGFELAEPAWEPPSDTSDESQS